MLFLFTVLAFLAPQDSLPDQCHCAIPDRIKAQTVNLDTLNYLDRKEKYQPGFDLTLQFLKTDSLDERLFYWVGKFSLKAAEQAVKNPEYRDRQYKKSNPHVKFNVIQDTIGFIHYEAQKNYGPRPWPNRINRQYGAYALCANRCLAYRYPHKEEFLGRYIQTLLAMKKVDELKTLVTDIAPYFPGEFSKKRMGRYLLKFNERFLGYYAYGPGLEFSKRVLGNFEVDGRIQQRWNDVYHYSLRNNPYIPDSIKPHMHESVQKHIPEIDKYD